MTNYTAGGRPHRKHGLRLGAWLRKSISGGVCRLMGISMNVGIQKGQTVQKRKEKRLVKHAMGVFHAWTLWMPGLPQSEEQVLWPGC